MRHGKSSPSCQTFFLFGVNVPRNQQQRRGVLLLMGYPTNGKSRSINFQVRTARRTAFQSPTYKTKQNGAKILVKISTACLQTTNKQALKNWLFQPPFAGGLVRHALNSYATMSLSGLKHHAHVFCTGLVSHHMYFVRDRTDISRFADFWQFQSGPVQNTCGGTQSRTKNMCMVFQSRQH